jgi:hypothetical protein
VLGVLVLWGWRHKDSRVLVAVINLYPDVSGSLHETPQAGTPFENVTGHTGVEFYVDGNITIEDEGYPVDIPVNHPLGYLQGGIGANLYASTTNGVFSLKTGNITTDVGAEWQGFRATLSPDFCELVGMRGDFGAHSEVVGGTTVENYWMGKPDDSSNEWRIHEVDLVVPQMIVLTPNGFINSHGAVSGEYGTTYDVMGDGSIISNSHPAWDIAWYYGNRTLYLPPQTFKLRFCFRYHEWTGAQRKWCSALGSNGQPLGWYDEVYIENRTSSNPALTSMWKGLVVFDTLQEALDYVPPTPIESDIEFSLFSLPEPISGVAALALVGSASLRANNPISGVGSVASVGGGHITANSMASFDIVFALLPNNESIAGAGSPMATAGSGVLGVTLLRTNYIAGIGRMALNGFGFFPEVDYTPMIAGVGVLVLGGSGAMSGNEDLQWYMIDGVLLDWQTDNKSEGWTTEDKEVSAWQT